jgi:hypothetical protein
MSRATSLRCSGVAAARAAGEFKALAWVDHEYRVSVRDAPLAGECRRGCPALARTRRSRTAQQRGQLHDQLGRRFGSDGSQLLISGYFDCTQVLVVLLNSSVDDLESLAVMQAITRVISPNHVWPNPPPPPVTATPAA